MAVGRAALNSTDEAKISDFPCGIPEIILSYLGNGEDTHDPNVLLSTIERTGPNGIAKGTPYQLLLWADDNYIRNEKGETFLEMIQRLLISHHGVETEVKQRESQFRDWEEKAQVAADQAAFNEVCQAFDASTATTDDELLNDATLAAAIIKFTIY